MSHHINQAAMLNVSMSAYAEQNTIDLLCILQNNLRYGNTIISRREFREFKLFRSKAHRFIRTRAL